MKHLAAFLSFTLLLASLAPLRAAEPKTLPPLQAELVALKPISLLSEKPDDIAFSDNLKSATPSTFSRWPGPGLSFQVEVLTRGKVSYDVELKVKTSVPVKKSEIVLARFLARAPIARQESGEGSLGFAFQRSVAPWEKSVGITFTPGPEWATYELPFTVANDFAAGEAGIAISLGDLAQTVEIRDLQLLDFGNNLTLDKLPKTLLTYKGREAGAAWREAALQRIEEIRTAPLTITVTDAVGKPLPGVQIDARLTQSDFLWGSSVNDQTLMAQTPDAERYRATIKEFFNTVVIENGLKWPTWSTSPERQLVAKNALDWIQQNGLRHKGHNMIWPGWKFSPRGQKDLPDLPTTLPKLIEARITEMTNLTKGRTIAWDVVNEPIHERDYFNVIPENSIADWYKLAHSIDPSLSLIINEYSILNSAMSPGMIARFRELIGRLRAAGAPISGIGVQSHIGQQPRAPEDILRDLDLLAAEGLPVQVTEFDVNTTDEALQADYTRDFLIACYSHPIMNGFIMWGFWQSQHWKPDSAMFRKDWSEKPNAAVWREWVLGKWKTHFNGATNTEGNATTRGHLGHYQITATRNGVSQTVESNLSHDGTKVLMQLR